MGCGEDDANRERVRTLVPCIGGVCSDTVGIRDTTLEPPTPPIGGRQCSRHEYEGSYQTKCKLSNDKQSTRVVLVDKSR